MKTKISEIKKTLKASQGVFDIMVEPGQCDALVNYINFNERTYKYIKERINCIISNTDDSSSSS